MKVQVKLFATYRSHLPPGTAGSALDVQVPVGTRVGDLLHQFGLPQNESRVILVNGLGAQEDQVLQENDVIAAFPAMAGG
jgi:molybdopterin converting factor small subunit